MYNCKFLIMTVYIISIMYSVIALVFDNCSKINGMELINCL